MKGSLSEIVKTCIMKTCPCKVYPLKPHFYKVKLGYAGVYLFFSSPEPKAHKVSS